MTKSSTQRHSHRGKGARADLNQEAEDQWLGWRLRQRRRQRQLSIRQLADRIGLSVGMVSQIERGLSTPSLRSLRLLAHALEVPVSWFFADSEQHAMETRYIVRHDQRRQLNVPNTGIVQEVISPESPGNIEIYHIALKPDASSGMETYSHEGEKAGLVLSGTLEIQIGQDEYILSPGDGFRFPSTLEHRFSNPGPKETQLIWVVHSHQAEGDEDRK